MGKVEISAEALRELVCKVENAPFPAGPSGVTEKARQALAEHDRKQNPLRLPWAWRGCGQPVTDSHGTQLTAECPDPSLEQKALIHAAPDLLAVVEEFAVSSNWIFDEYRREIVARARAALKKARGEP